MKSLLSRSKVFLAWVFAWAWFIGAPLSIITLTACSGSGCKSVTTNTYKASGVTHVTAVAALKVWNEYVGVAYAQAASNTDTNKAALARAELLAKEEQVQAAWEKYQAAQISLLNITQSFSKVDPNAPHDPTAWDRLSQASIAASEAAAELVGLLRKFGLKV